MAKKSSQLVATVWRGRTLDTFLPDKCIVTTKIVATVFLNTTLFSQGFCWIEPTSYYRPFNTAYPISGAGSLGSSSFGGFVNTAQGAGYNKMSDLYKNYKVVGGTAVLKVASNNNLDSTYWAMTMSPIATAFTGVQNSVGLIGNDNVKTKLCSIANEMEIRYPYTCAECLGLSKSQYDNLPAVAQGTSPPSTQGIILFIQWQQADSTQLSQNQPVVLELTQRVEFTSKNLFAT